MTLGEFVKTACPHDCPSACLLEVERVSPSRIGRVRGNASNSYTAGVCCAKVARYAERAHHPDRLSSPLRRIGPKGEGRFVPIPWSEAIAEIAEAFTQATQRHGSESVWPYHSGGNMGIVNRWGLDRLRHAFRYSRQHSTICMTPAESGWKAGVGALRGCDPREMAEADLILVWGGNPVSTQVNAMTHITRARKTRGAKLVVIDVYRTPSVEAADIGLVLRPGTDAALALGMMHVLLSEGLADRDYLARYTDFGPDVETHIGAWTPERAAAITGLDAEQIVDLARLYGTTERSFLRLGFGFTRARNGSASMHAVSCLPAVTGAWRHRGGGAFFVTFEDWGLDLSLAHGLGMRDDGTRILDQSRIADVLAGDAGALKGGPPVTAMLMQNANSADVAPDSRRVAEGLARPDLFLCVHEQFMTRTAQFADIVLPAAMFVETDDLYYGYGHTHLTVGRTVVERHAECRSNHEVVCDLARALGSDDPSFAMSGRELLTATLKASGFEAPETVLAEGWIDRAKPFETAHFLDGFPQPGGRFRFKPDWASVGPYAGGMPSLPDFLDNRDPSTDQLPYRLVTPPARTFLNTTFNETPGSRSREKAPVAILHPEDAGRLGVGEGDRLLLGNGRGTVRLNASPRASAQPGTIVVEGIWTADAFEGGSGINSLVGSDPVPPNGGVAFHDTTVWARAEPSPGRTA